MNPQKYEEIKDSEIPWVGDIPEKWEVKPLLVLCKENHRKNTAGKRGNVLSLSYGNLVKRDIESNFGLIPESFDSYQILEPGNIILRLTDLQNDKKSLRVGLAKESGIITSAYIGLIVNPELNSDFLYYLLHSYDINKVFYGMGGGVRQSIKFSDLKCLPLVLPSKDEQKEIIDFLKKELKINSYTIQNNKKIIDLLKEKRQTIINYVITKGLDPTVPMKDSGIEWIGNIPKYWKVRRLRNISKIKTGGKDTEDNEEDGKYPFFVRSQTVERISTYSFDGEAILTAGDGAGVGKVFHYVNGKFDFHQRVYKISDFVGINGKYLYYYIQDNFHKEVMKISAKSTVDSLRLIMFHNFPVVFGSKDEQNQISEFLDKKTSKIDSLISKIESQIHKLQEYRHSLISATVTGKIDVRNNVAILK